MKVKIISRMLILIFSIFSLLFTTDGLCVSKPIRIEPVLKQSVLAQSSRLALKGLIYQRGVEMEMSGNLAGALRIWLNAYNLNSRDEIVSRRLYETYKTLLRTVHRKYRDAFYDLQYGRPSRAHAGLQSAHDLLDGIDKGLDEKIVNAIDKIKTTGVK